MRIDVTAPLYSFAFIAILVSCSTAQLASADSAAETLAAMDRCNQDSDCVAAPEVFPACFAYCKDKECEGAKECPALNRFFKNFPSCAARVPCLPIKSKIVCLKNVCQTRS